MPKAQRQKSNLKQAPVILISPETEMKGDEFEDPSISLSEAYQKAVIAAGGLPLTLPCVASRETLAGMRAPRGRRAADGRRGHQSPALRGQVAARSPENGGRAPDRAGFAGIDAGGRDFPAAQAGFRDLPGAPDDERGAGGHAGGGYSNPASRRAGAPAVRPEGRSGA